MKMSGAVSVCSPPSSSLTSSVLGAREGCPAAHERDAGVFLSKLVVQALARALAQPMHPLNYRRKVDFRGWHLNAQLAGRAHQMGPLRRGQQRLGGGAAVVGAGAAQEVGFN